MNKHSIAVGLAGLALLGALCAPAAADQLYVRNRPFKGTVQTSEGRLWVDLKTFAEAMEATVVASPEGGSSLVMPGEEPSSRAVPAGKVSIGDEMVESQQGSDGVVMVPLDETARLVGARVIANKSMGTIDVSLAKALSKKNKAAASAPVPTGPIVKQINRAGSAVDVQSQLIAGRINIVDFGADW